jgi:hypothetical protein
MFRSVHPSPQLLGSAIGQTCSILKERVLTDLTFTGAVT